MGWWPFSKEKQSGRAAENALFAHLDQFIQTRRGVEAYLEPKTRVTDYTILLIAWDGEWTRRRIHSPQAISGWAHQRGIPVYDANIVGYPQRMRDWNARQKGSG